MKNIIERCPVTVAGLILAFFSLGNLWKALITKLFNISWLALAGYWLFAIAGLIFFIILAAKFILQRKMVLAMLEKSGPLASVTTLPMAVTVFAGYCSAIPLLSQILWWTGCITHVIIMLIFTWKFVLHNFSLKELLPSWYIVYVGFAICGFSSKDYAPVLFGQVSAVFSAICFTLIFIGIILRARKFRFTEMQEPLLCINCAIGIVSTSYLRNFENPSMILIWIGLIAGTLIWFWILFQLPGWLKDPFFPSDSALSFPFVVSAISTMEAMKHLMNSPFHTALMVLLICEAVVALFMVLITCFRFVKKMG